MKLKTRDVATVRLGIINNALVRGRIRVVFVFLFAVLKNPLIMDGFSWQNTRKVTKSILTKRKCPTDEDLFVFGYSCKLYKDDEKARLINSGRHLIPWMGQPSLMIDRFVFCLSCFTNSNCLFFQNCLKLIQRPVCSLAAGRFLG